MVVSFQRFSLFFLPKEMANPVNRTKLHVVMFPWFAYGHMIPFVHLANKLAEKGHRVSFLLPRSAQLKLGSHLSQHPDLIRSYTLTIPPVDGLPPHAETTSDLPIELYQLLFNAFDQTREQVRSHLLDLEPDLVFYDLAFWVAALGRDRPGGFKSVVYQVVNSVMLAYTLVPSRMLLANQVDDVAVEELKRLPPGFPATRISVTHYDVFKALVNVFKRDVSGDLSFYERTSKVVQESDAIALMTTDNLEAPFCDYLRKEYEKPVLLTGPIVPPAPAAALEEKWANWLNRFEAGSVVYCGIGSQAKLELHQFQELVLGFELTGLPFLVALLPPKGYNTIEDALPEGFQERVQGRGWVYGGWVPQPQILNHPSVGCFVGHCGLGCMWEALLSNCRIVLFPQMLDHFMGAKLMADELRVAVEVERGETMWVSKEAMSKAIKLVMDRENEVAKEIEMNHAKLRQIVSAKQYQEDYLNNFIQSLQDLLESSS